MQKSLMVAVVGPTGSGKSDLALGLAETFHGEIVNCDSLQLYRYMDIGTAKTPPEQRRGIPHHLIDILDPDEVFTAGDYIRLARPILNDIAARGRLPIVVGGTGFYLRALLNGLFDGPARDEALRERLLRRSPASIHRLLRRFDPAAAKRIHPNDVQKATRALEVCILSRKPITSLHEENRTPLEGFQVLKLGLDPPRDELVKRIDERCRHMFDSGLVQEVQRILELRFPPTSKALESIGYRETILHLSGELSLEEAVQQTQISTRQYAKRQRTWFRRESDVVWVNGFGTSAECMLFAAARVQQCLALT